MGVVIWKNSLLHFIKLHNGYDTYAMRHNQEPQRTVAAENGLKNNPQIYERFKTVKIFFLVKLEKSFECN